MGRVSRTFQTRLETTTRALEKNQARLKGQAFHGERRRWLSSLIVWSLEKHVLTKTYGRFRKESLFQAKKLAN